MRALELAVAVITLLIWLYLFFARGRFWQLDRLAAPPNQPCDIRSIVAIIPARNEADVIAQSLASLLHIPSIHVVLVDDNSTDDTSGTARRTAQQQGTSDRLTIVTGQPLRPDWSGKLWAVDQGVETARKYQPNFFLLTDADIVHSPGDLERLIATAENGRYDLVSLMVRLRCDNLAEKLLIPAFVYFFFKLYPPALIRNPRNNTAGAAGGCILIRPEALERAGGIRAIHNEIIDDCALARIVKRSGGNIRLALAAETRSIRSYGSFAAIGGMISRTAFNQLRHSSLLLLATIVGLVLTYLAPVALLFSSNVLAVIFAFGALVLMMTSYLPITRYYRRSPLWVLTLPLAAAFYMGATIYSALQFWQGHGGEWKGRAQDPVHNRLT